MSAHVEGVPEFRAALARASAAMDVAAAEAVAKGAHLVQANTQRLLTAKAHGWNTPTPSAPGEPPATVTGTLKRSIQVQGPRKSGFATYIAEVGPTVVYARAQELGNPANTWGGHAAPLPARPSLAPALAASHRELGAIYRAAWGSAWAT